MKQQPTYDLQRPEDLSKFLLGCIRDVKNKELKIEEATAISQLADKYVKNNISIMLYKKVVGSKSTIPEFEPKINQALIQKTN